MAFAMIRPDFLKLCHPRPWRDSVSWSLPKTSFFRFMHPCSVNAPFALIDEIRACWLLSPNLKFFRRKHGELCVLRLETRVLHMRLAFGVHDLKNFKSALLRSPDANVTSSASWGFRCGPASGPTSKSFKTRVRVFDICSRLNYQTWV